MPAVFPILSGAFENTPLLMASDVVSGMTRGVYEKAMGSSTSRAVTEMAAQTIGSQTARMFDTYDDNIPMAGTYVTGNMPLAKSVYTGAVTGTLDWAMSRGSGWKRFAVPVATDGVSGVLYRAASGGQDTRIL
jgi:hypothetical protein